MKDKHLQSSCEQEGISNDWETGQFPNHWRSPLAHKKIGDVYLSQGLNDEAKEKYQYVANSYPENTAASLALQILENME